MFSLKLAKSWDDFMTFEIRMFFALRMMILQPSDEVEGKAM